MIEKLKTISWKRQLEEHRKALLLIEEKISQHPLRQDVPLQLTENQRRLENRIAELEAMLARARHADDAKKDSPVQDGWLRWVERASLYQLLKKWVELRLGRFPIGVPMLFAFDLIAQLWILGYLIFILIFFQSRGEANVEREQILVVLLSVATVFFTHLFLCCDLVLRRYSRIGAYGTRLLAGLIASVGVIVFMF